jgi:ankyrin repeat protein
METTMCNLIFIFLSIFAMNNSLIGCDKKLETQKVKKTRSEETNLKIKFSLSRSSKEKVKKSRSLPSVNEDSVSVPVFKNHGLFTIILSQNHTLLTSCLKNRFLNLNIQDKEGNTPLHCAVKKQDFKAMQKLLEDPRTKVSIKNNSNKTPRDLLKVFIIEESESDSISDNRIEEDPALRYSRMLFFRHFLNLQVKKYAKNYPTGCIIKKEIIETSNLMIDQIKMEEEEQKRTNKNLPVDTQCPSYVTPDFVAEMIYSQLSDKSKEIIKDTGNHGLFLIASSTNKLIYLTAYLENKFFDFNIQNKEGNTPLHIAAINQNFKGMQKLLEDPRPDGSMKNNAGKIPQQVIETLKKHSGEDDPILHYSRKLFARFTLNAVVKKQADLLKIRYSDHSCSIPEDELIKTANSIIEIVKQDTEKQQKINKEAPIPAEAQYPTYATLEFVIDMLNLQLTQPQ